GGGVVGGAGVGGGGGGGVGGGCVGRGVGTLHATATARGVRVVGAGEAEDVLAGVGEVDRGDPAVALVGGVQVGVAVLGRGDGERGAALAAAGGHRPATGLHLGTVTDVDLVYLAVVGVDVDELAAGLHRRGGGGDATRA